MLVDVLMVIMKMLFNNKGISLVILLIAMTLIAVLGASFVSLMSAKQKSFLHQIDSYRALNIANAGVEYAIRYASDGLDTNNNSVFYSNPTLTTIGKGIGGGAFSVNYTYNQTITNDLLTVTGTYSGSSREVRLLRLRRYINPITLVPDSAPISRPRLDSNDTIIPVITNNENAFFVTRIDVTVNASNIYLNIERDGTAVFDYGTSPYPVCGSTPAPICKDSTQGIFLGTTSIRFDLSPPNHSPDSINVYRLRFSAPAPTGQYTLQFYTSLPAGNPFGIRFSL
jgi:Tfp pilus assembly protein PilX